MGTNLNNVLRSLCFNTVWKYAIFWKLKHRDRMMLTWEDAYYDDFEQHDLSEYQCFVELMRGGHFPRDSLGLAVAKMAYHVYSLGEGIVGQVAVTGKHQWIFADKHAISSFSSFEFSDGWQSQFSAGLKTIVVVAVNPYGVVQLGSLNKVVEDMKLVAHIKDAFIAFQDSSVGNINSPVVSHMKRSICPETAVEVVNKHESVELVTEGNDESVKLLKQKSNISYIEYQQQLRMNLISNRMYAGDNSAWKYPDGGSECNLTTHSHLDSTIYNIMKSDGMDVYLNGLLNAPESSDTNFKNDLEKLEYQADSSHFADPKTFLKFSAGSELHEALGPAFLKQCMNFDCEAEKTEVGNAVEMLEEMSSSQMTFETTSENLLEAVVGSNVYRCGNAIKSEKSVCESDQSLLMTEKMPDPFSPTKHPIYSSGYSVDQNSIVKEDTQNCSNSMESSRIYSSACPSICSEQLNKRSEPAKNHKKKAKHGENCRPRPRDRQLIQDRIKELRDLVPNGSKCSIDSLLERTIKYMLFLESITKHADKLNNCESKMHQKGTDTSNHEQGSSWAVEVGGHLKVSSIIVKNLNKNGQMLVEMLCEESSHFLEIADAIRSLGLTILKGITEAHREQTWVCFVVEGHNNRMMHRMDILWSLVQMLQPKTMS